MSARDTVFVVTGVRCVLQEERRGLGLGMELLTLFSRNATGGCDEGRVL